MYLLDTCTFLWFAWGDDRRLSRRVFELTIDPEAKLYLSVVSRWEIALKQHKPDFALGGTFETIWRRAPFLPLPLAFEIPERLIELPSHHSDPFDRLLIAQALHEDLTLVTSDSQISLYEVPVIW